MSIETVLSYNRIFKVLKMILERINDIFSMNIRMEHTMSVISEKLAGLEAKVTELEASETSELSAIAEEIARCEALITSLMNSAVSPEDLALVDALSARVDALKSQSDVEKAELDAERPDEPVA